jgi:hypothetical protein
MAKKQAPCLICAAAHCLGTIIWFSKRRLDEHPDAPPLGIIYHGIDGQQVADIQGGCTPPDPKKHDLDRQPWARNSLNEAHRTPCELGSAERINGH